MTKTHAVAPTGDTPVNDALNSFPGAIAVFLGRRMHCVGCPVNELHSLADAAREHSVPLADLIDELGGPALGRG